MADAREELRKHMVGNLHHTMKAVFDTECYHGVYSGGPKDGQSFATCEELADRLLPIVPEIPEDQIYVDITDFTTGKYLSTADTFDGGEHWAWGYLHGIGSRINDGKKILVHAKSTGAYSIVISGAILERGDDWEYTVLNGKREAALKAAEDAQRALDEHLIARMAKEDAARMDPEDEYTPQLATTRGGASTAGPHEFESETGMEGRCYCGYPAQHHIHQIPEEPKLILTASDKVAAAKAARKAGQPYRHLLPTNEELEA